MYIHLRICINICILQYIHNHIYAHTYVHISICNTIHSLPVYVHIHIYVCVYVYIYKLYIFNTSRKLPKPGKAGGVNGWGVSGSTTERTKQHKYFANEILKLGELIGSIILSINKILLGEGIYLIFIYSGLTCRGLMKAISRQNEIYFFRNKLFNIMILFM